MRTKKGGEGDESVPIRLGKKVIAIKIVGLEDGISIQVETNSDKSQYVNSLNTKEYKYISMVTTVVVKILVLIYLLIAHR